MIYEGIHSELPQRLNVKLGQENGEKRIFKSPRYKQDTWHVQLS